MLVVIAPEFNRCCGSLDLDNLRAADEVVVAVIEAAVADREFKQLTSLVQPVGEDPGQICSLEQPVHRHVGMTASCGEVDIVVQFVEIAGRARVFDELLEVGADDKLLPRPASPSSSPDPCAGVLG